MEYACMINVIPGTTVTVVDPRPDVLPFADSDVIENLQYSMRQNGEAYSMVLTVSTNCDRRLSIVFQKCFESEMIISFQSKWET